MHSKTCRLLFVACVFTSAAALAACTDSDPVGTDTFPGELRRGASLDDAPRCDVDTACPAGLDCVVVHLEAATAGPICVDETICELLDCGDGECVILESYPAMVTCSGSAGDGDGDEPVCSDGSC